MDNGGRDRNGGQTQDSSAWGAGFKLSLWRILCCSLHFFPFSSEVLEKVEVFPQTGEGEFNKNKTLL